MILLSSNNDKHIEKIITNLVQISKSIRDIKRVVIVLHDQFDEKRYFKSVPDIDIYYMNDIFSSFLLLLLLKNFLNIIIRLTLSTLNNLITQIFKFFVL